MAANKAVILELNEHMDAFQMTCAAGTSISKGDLLKLSGDNTVVASTPGDTGVPYGGIAAMDKDGTDSSTQISVYLPGQGNKFDMTCAAGGAVTIGHAVVLSGANVIRDAIAADLLTGAVIGTAKEAGDVNEVIVVYS